MFVSALGSKPKLNTGVKKGVECFPFRGHETHLDDEAAGEDDDDCTGAAADRHDSNDGDNMQQ